MLTGMGEKKNYRITLFSPDNHVKYDGATPDERGIGGGVTARVRLLRALAQLGHEVVAYVNCERPAVYDGVQYLHFSEATSIDTDIFIAITTGGALDLEPACRIPVQARLKIVWIGGVPKPTGIENLGANFVYVPSNFLRDVVVSSWDIPPNKVFVSYNGLEQRYFSSAEEQRSQRDPYALVYVGHPSKGLDPAISAVEALCSKDSRFHLDVFGGPEIRGEPAQNVAPIPGVNFRGSLGQKTLVNELFKYGFCLALQRVPEGFGIGVQECMRAGVIVIASAVGAFLELIKHGYNGFLVEGDPDSPETRDQVTQIILELLSQPEYMDFVRQNAEAVPWDWNLTALAWVSHWDFVLNGIDPAPSSEPEEIQYSCPSCSTPVTRFPDGYHCLKCATYYPIIRGIPNFTSKSGRYSEISEPDFRLLLGRVRQDGWREAVKVTLAEKSQFLVNYILDESRGFFHYLLDLPTEARALDLGAGFGAVACAIGRRYRVVALDNHLLRLVFLDERRRQECLSTVVPVHGDILSLPFYSEQFDLVTMIGVLEWAGAWSTEETAEDVQLQLLRKAHQVLKPGGYLVIGIENRYGAKYLLGEPDDHTGIRNITYLPRDEADILSIAARGTPYHIRTHSRADYEQLLRIAGFQSVSFYAPYPDYRLWSALIPLDNPDLLRFYLERIEPERTPDMDLQRSATQLGIGREFVNSYLIVGRK